MNTNEVLKFAQDHRNDIEEDVFCDICETSEDLLNERDKRELTDDWAGVNFYEELCRPCFLEIKENN